MVTMKRPPHKPGDVTRSGKTVVDVRMAGEDHAVLTVTGKGSECMKKPCPTCPWRKDAVGIFPASAFKHSAATSFDMAENVFACHQSGADKGHLCAGFMLRGADNNLTVRIGIATGRLDMRKISDGGVELFDSYRDMAVANGVPPDDPAIEHCRP